MSGDQCTAGHTAGVTRPHAPDEPAAEQYAGQVYAAVAAEWPDVVDTLQVSECFGKTVQGEGPHAGRPAVFLRLMGCNLSCSWCDTAYTWDHRYFDLRGNTLHATAGQLWDDHITPVAEPDGNTLLVITGGEPLLQQGRPAWRNLLERCAPHTAAGGYRAHRAYPVHIETNGTVAPTQHTLQYADAIAVSPKLGNAGRHRGRQTAALNPEWLAAVHRHPGVFFKVVVTDGADATSAADWLRSEGVPAGRVWLMPEGITDEQVNSRWREVAEAAAAAGVNATHRLHVLAWGSERGH